MSFALVLIFKNFLFHFSEMCAYLPRIPLSQGRFGQSSRTLGAGCDGRKGGARRARPVRTAKSCGPDLPTLGSSLPIGDVGPNGPTRRDRQATVAKKPGTPGRTRISRKTIARGMPDDVGVPAVTNSRVFYTTREAAGARCARHSLRPPL